MNVIDKPADEPRKRGRPKVSSDDDKRAHIVENARRIFLKYGYAGSTTAVVAVEAGVSKQTLYKLFESKEALFAATVSAHRRLMLDLPREREDVSIAESLERIFMIDIDEEKDAERAGFLQLVFREAGQFPELDRYPQSRRHARQPPAFDRLAQRPQGGRPNFARRSRQRRSHAHGHDLRRDGAAGRARAGMARSATRARPSQTLHCHILGRGVGRSADASSAH
jgi:AcrR family transcriptional regulator